tara:strand:+ start:3317 stop:6151 length:2835 start_codon:yes stop_codon:yes gene_type:complete
MSGIYFTHSRFFQGGRALLPVEIAAKQKERNAKVMETITEKKKKQRKTKTKTKIANNAIISDIKQKKGNIQSVNINIINPKGGGRSKREKQRDPTPNIIPKTNPYGFTAAPSFMYSTERRRPDDNQAGSARGEAAINARIDRQAATIGELNENLTNFLREQRFREGMDIPHVDPTPRNNVRPPARAPAGVPAGVVPPNLDLVFDPDLVSPSPRARARGLVPSPNAPQPPPTPSPPAPRGRPLERRVPMGARRDILTPEEVKEALRKLQELDPPRPIEEDDAAGVGLRREGSGGFPTIARPRRPRQKSPILETPPITPRDQPAPRVPDNIAREPAAEPSLSGNILPVAHRKTPQELDNAARIIQQRFLRRLPTGNQRERAAVQSAKIQTDEYRQGHVQRQIRQFELQEAARGRAKEEAAALRIQQAARAFKNRPSKNAAERMQRNFDEIEADTGAVVPINPAENQLAIREPDQQVMEQLIQAPLRIRSPAVSPVMEPTMRDILSAGARDLVFGKKPYIPEGFALAPAPSPAARDERLRRAAAREARRRQQLQDNAIVFVNRRDVQGYREPATENRPRVRPPATPNQAAIEEVAELSAWEKLQLNMSRGISTETPSRNSSSGKYKVSGNITAGGNFELTNDELDIMRTWRRDLGIETGTKRPRPSRAELQALLRRRHLSEGITKEQFDAEYIRNNRKMSDIAARDAQPLAADRFSPYAGGRPTINQALPRDTIEDQPLALPFQGITTDDNFDFSDLMNAPTDAEIMLRRRQEAAANPDLSESFSIIPTGGGSEPAAINPLLGLAGRAAVASANAGGAVVGGALDIAGRAGYAAASTLSSAAYDAASGVAGAAYNALPSAEAVGEQAAAGALQAGGYAADLAYQGAVGGAHMIYEAVPPALDAAADALDAGAGLVQQAGQAAADAVLPPTLPFRDYQPRGNLGDFGE